MDINEPIYNNTSLKSILFAFLQIYNHTTLPNNLFML